MKELLDKALPGTAPRIVAALGVAITAGAYTLFPDLPATWLPAADGERFLVRLVATLTAFSVSAVAVLIALIVHINTRAAPDLAAALRRAEERTGID